MSNDNKQGDLQSTDDSDVSDVAEPPKQVNNSSNIIAESKPDIIQNVTDAKSADDSPWDSEEEDESVGNNAVPFMEPLKMESSNEAVRPSKGDVFIYIHRVFQQNSMLPASNRTEAQ